MNIRTGIRRGGYFVIGMVLEGNDKRGWSCRRVRYIVEVEEWGGVVGG